ncbi:hypothetical protein FDP41_006030 [Naegleria fowleri]|uniref:BTB domain-containing protein n=1 Tax=Naegleria fowleri TaxID=5763 RepID=A0A6A5BMX9_NAEFO|nr:uncharacterized protein FDP41_006030 [Naegleria fowleri]KAF0974925.1 hypothetical protein FDP41_006030 [Naegleria fowleri]
MSSKLSRIDLGTVNFPKKCFDILLVWVYSGKFMDLTSSKKEIQYSLSQVFAIKDFLSVAESLKIYDAVDFLKAYQNKVKEEEITKNMADAFLKSMEASFFLESHKPETKLELMRKLCCDFKLKIENYLEETSFVPTNDSILCHKDFLTERSSFFKVMIECNFDEGEKIRELQAHHEFPILHLQCCNFSVLEELCRCLYSEKMNLNEQNALELFSYVHRLGMRQEILLECERYIKKMDIDVSEIYSFCKEGKKKWLLNRELKYERFFPIEFMNDKQFVLNHIKKYGFGLKYTSPQLKEDRELVLQVVQLNGIELQYASYYARNDREVVLEAIKNEAFALDYASPSLQNDKVFMLEVIRWNEKCLEYAPYDLREEDSEFLCEAIKQNKKALHCLSWKLRQDEKFMLKLIKSLFPEFNLISIDQANKEIMMKLVKEFGFLLKFASKELKNDRDIVLNAVKHDGWAFSYASHDLKSDREIAFQAVTKEPLTLNGMPDELINDKELVLVAVNQDGWALEYASDELRNDRQVVLTAIRQTGLALQYADEMLKRDQEIVFEAVKQNNNAFRYASKEFFNDKEFLLKLAKLGCRNVFKYVPKEIVEDREFVLKVIKINSLAVIGPDDSPFRHNEEILLEAVRNNGFSLCFAKGPLQDDPELVMEAFKCHGFVFEYSDELLQQRMEQCYFGAYLD